MSLLKAVSETRNRHGVDLAMLDVVDLKTGRGCSGQELVDYFRKQTNALLSITAVFGIIYVLTRFNPAFIKNPIYASVFMGVMMAFGWLVLYSVVTSSKLVLDRIVNKFGRGG
jgi:uncharacterized membrane protein (DUF485 family)